jgi:hypothetical protein
MFNPHFPVSQFNENHRSSIFQVHFVDLRVGLNENDFYHLVEMKGCVAFLEEIDRCRPFFIGFYGHKYGTPLLDYRMPKEPRWSKVFFTHPSLSFPQSTA